MDGAREDRLLSHTHIWNNTVLTIDRLRCNLPYKNIHANKYKQHTHTEIQTIDGMHSQRYSNVKCFIFEVSLMLFP